MDVHCPRCQATARQVKDGHTPSGNQRYRCRACGCRYTPFPRDRGYDEEVRLQALRMHLEGLSLRAISRILEVNHQSVANWINAYATHLPLDIPDSILELIELDALLPESSSPRN